MAKEREKFFNSVKRLHIYYRDQLSSALISVNKFEKGTKYFIRALRVISPVSYDDIPVLTLNNLEEELNIYRENSPETESTSDQLTESRLDATADLTRASSARVENDAKSQHRAHCQIVETFLKNINNFRLFRQHVKMNIVRKLQKFPKDVVETDMQKRTLGELEALLGAWTVLTDRNNNLLRLVHPEVRERADILLENEQEVAYYMGILSVLPKLTDIANKIEFALTKYEMSADIVG